MEEIDDVRTFHQNYNLPRPWTPTAMAPENMSDRIEALNTFFEGYVAACTQGSLAGQADALSVLIFLLMSEVVWRGLPWQKLWDDTIETMLMNPQDLHEMRRKRISAILAQAGYEEALESQLPLPLGE